MATATLETPATQARPTIDDKLAVLRDFIARNGLDEKDIISATVVCYEAVPRLHVQTKVGVRLFAGTGRTPIDRHGYVNILCDGVGVVFAASEAAPSAPKYAEL